MFKKVLFRVHWFIGITAGVVLAIVGLTGGMLAFEQEILRQINSGVMRVAPGAAPALSPADLVGRIQAESPGKRIATLTLFSSPQEAARAGFAAEPPARRGESRYVNPYTGEILPRPKGEEFFRTVTQIHRCLASGDVGKHIVGASTLGLVVMALSGLYLRWPRKIFDWRVWLALNRSQKGRAFLWSLHSVMGTWVMLCYLLAALTGLYWSYDWYRDALFSLTGAPRPVQTTGPAKPERPGAERLQAPNPASSNRGTWTARGTCSGRKWAAMAAPHCDCRQRPVSLCRSPIWIPIPHIRVQSIASCSTLPPASSSSMSAIRTNRLGARS